MNKAEYLESQRGRSYAQIVAEQPMEEVQGSLLRSHYQEIKTVLASGLRNHMKTFVADTVDKSAALDALIETFDPVFLASEDFKVNFNVSEVFRQYQFCIDTGALPQSFATRLLDLAKYQRPLHSITREDCANYFNPGWHELPATDATSFVLMLNTPAPEQTHIVIQAQDQYDNGTSDWYHAQALHGIEVVRQYVAQLPHNGSPRKLRWKCDYALSAVVSVR